MVNEKLSISGRFPTFYTAKFKIFRLLSFHIIQMEIQSPNRYLDFADRNGQR